MRVGLLASLPLLNSKCMTNHSAKALFEALKTQSATTNATRRSVNLANASMMEQDFNAGETVLYRGCVNGDYIVRDSVSDFVGSVKRSKADHVVNASEYGDVSVGLNKPNTSGARIVTSTVI